MIRFCRLKVKVTLEGQNLTLKIFLNYRVRSINPILIEGFLHTCLKCSPPQGDVQNPCCPCVNSRSRSQLRVKYQTIKYKTICLARSVRPSLIEIFSLFLAKMFTQTMGCAEPMLPFFRLTDKITLKDKKLTSKYSLILICILIFLEIDKGICLKHKIYMKCYN